MDFPPLKNIDIFRGICLHVRMSGKRFSSTCRQVVVASAPALSLAVASGVRLRANPVPPDPDRARAEALFAKRHWADAEKAFMDYANRMPTPPDRAEAWVKAGVCRLERRDAAGARRRFEQAAYDEAARRRSPEAVAEAFDRLHMLHLGQGASAAVRARLLDDCRRRLPDCAALRRMQEREGDALLASNQPRQALSCYIAAGSGLSPGGDERRPPAQRMLRRQPPAACRGGCGAARRGVRG